jgi:hypothetical protein
LLLFLLISMTFTTAIMKNKQNSWNLRVILSNRTVYLFIEY